MNFKEKNTRLQKLSGFRRIPVFRGSGLQSFYCTANSIATIIHKLKNLNYLSTTLPNLPNSKFKNQFQ